MNFDVLEDRPIRMMWSKQDPSIRNSVNGHLLVRNLNKSVDHKTLFDTFSEFGRIVSYKVSIPYDKLKLILSVKLKFVQFLFLE